MMRSLLVLVLAAFGAISAATAMAQGTLRTIPVVELGEPLRLANGEVEMLLPKGFQVAPDSAAIEAERQRVLATEWRRAVDAGNVPRDAKEPRLEFRKLADAHGNVLLVTMREPAQRPLSSPIEFQQEMARELVTNNLAWQGVGPPQEFRARGGRVGFLAERQIALAPGGPFAMHQVLAWLPAEGRDVVAIFTAPLAGIEARQDEFVAAMGSILIGQEKTAVRAVDHVKPHAPPGPGETGFWAEVAVGVAALLLLAVVLRARAPAP